MAEKISLVQKIAKVRCDFLARDVKKSGKNKYAGFSYFELKDILPISNELCEKYGILPVYSFHEEHAKLTILDSDSESEISFVIATRNEDTDAKLGQDKQSRGMQPVQRLGSVVTYCKRYLYLNFLDIVEDDSIDGLPQEEPKTQPKQQDKTPQKQQKNNSVGTQEEIDLSVEYTHLRTKLTELGVNFREDETIKSYIMQKANVGTQDIEMLDTNSLKRLVDVYKGIVLNKEGANKCN